jgi:hypothetical protein
LKQIHFRKTEGKRISIVHDVSRGWRTYKCRTKTPDSNLLFNFNLEATDGKDLLSFLVLDPYGDETLSSAIRKRVGLGPICGQPLAICRKTGVLHLTSFFEKDGEWGLTFWRFAEASCGLKKDEYVLPKKYLARIDELKSKKRPFDISAIDSAFVGFIDRTTGFNDMSTSLVVSLDFDKTNVEIWGDSHREVSGWKSSQ